MKYSIQLTPLALAICMAHPALAQSPAMPGTVSGTMPEVHVVGQALPQPLAGSDSSQLLSNVAGYNVAAGGGVSGLPVMNGFADDRLKIRIDGMELSSACANHMNAPLSYIAPKQVGKIRMLAGLTPVSMGGDSIGGSIEVRVLDRAAFRRGIGFERRLLAALRAARRGQAENDDAPVSRCAHCRRVTAYARALQQQT